MKDIKFILDHAYKTIFRNKKKRKKKLLNQKLHHKYVYNICKKSTFYIFNY